MTAILRAPVPVIEALATDHPAGPEPLTHKQHGEFARIVMPSRSALSFSLCSAPVRQPGLDRGLRLLRQLAHQAGRNPIERLEAPLHLPWKLNPMQTKSVLTITETTRILEAARAEAEKNSWAVAIAVVDDGGHLLGLLRLDGCAPISSEMATGKARTSAIGRRESRVYEEMINNGRNAFLSAPLVATLEGGVPVIVDGQVVGAIGVSGVKSSEDAQIAKAGAQAIA
jgi:glc operon protein GlcG